MNTNENIELRLKKEIEESVPDAFPIILEKIKSKDTTPVIPFDLFKKKKTPIRNIISIAAAFAIIFTGIFAFMQNGNNTFDVEFDVNPGIILEVNENNKVVDVETLNDDAVYVLDSMDLKGSELKVAVNAIMYSIIKNGYIDEMTNSVLVSVSDSDYAKKNNISQSIADEINTTFTANAIEGSVLVQTMEDDTDVLEMAQKYNITVGKASLIKHLVDSGKTAYSQDSLANLSINELNLILSAKEATQDVTVFGHASTKAYIGDNIAKNIAYSAANIDPLTVKHSTCEIDLEESIIIYDVEFIVPGAIYECEIDALTGEVCDIEVEPVDDLYTEEISSNIESNPTVVFKTKEEIKQLLLDMNGLSAADCHNFTITLDYDDSIAKYEVEFISGNVEYDYEVNAVDGTVLSFSHENIVPFSEPTVTEPTESVYSETTAPYVNEATSNSTVPVTEPSQADTTASNGYIGKDEAIRIALNHAGIPEASKVRTETEFGFNNGVIYNIEFKYNRCEYEYEIDASTGEIVDFEKEHDD